MKRIAIKTIDDLYQALVIPKILLRFLLLLKNSEISTCGIGTRDVIRKMVKRFGRYHQLSRSSPK